MNYKVEKTEHYALIQLNEEIIDQNIAPQLEKIIVGLYNEKLINMIVDFSKVIEIEQSGLTLLEKATRVCRKEQGLFVVCTKNDDILDQIDEKKIPEIILLPTVDEGIDAVFMNDLENEFSEGAASDDEDFDLGEENGFTEGHF